MVSRASSFKPPDMVRCQYTCNDIRVYDYDSREPKTTCVDYGLLVPISEMKDILGIDTGIVSQIFGFPMQKS